VGEKDRDGFLTYLKQLRKTTAEVDGKATRLNGHDQIITSLQENLESKRPSPVYFTWHPKGASRWGVVQVTSSDRALNFSSKTFLTISVPTVPADRPKAGARKK
jgi:hypothetical protein